MNSTPYKHFFNFFNDFFIESYETFSGIFIKCKHFHKFVLDIL